MNCLCEKHNKTILSYQRCIVCEQAAEIKRLKEEVCALQSQLLHINNKPYAQENKRLKEFIVRITKGSCKFCVHDSKEYDELPCVDCAEQSGSPDFNFIGIEQALKGE